MRTDRSANDSAPRPDTLVFRSKVDAPIGGLMVGSAVASVSVVLTAALTTHSIWLALALCPLLLGPAGLPVWLLLSTRYSLTASYLEVRSGPFKWRIPLSDIRSVAHTRNPTPSPALSADRLRIRYGHGQLLLVSPREKMVFLEELEKRRRAAIDRLAKGTEPSPPEEQ